MTDVPSFYWFDYETFGRSAAWDRPAQFAGRRTDPDLNPVGEPEVFYCRLPGDYLPDPGACRITGITPSRVMQDGLPEADFIRRVTDQLGVPATVSVGYNNIGFDDEFTRYTLFRNLADPYAHSWQNGCSRWDLLDVLRLTRALRPDGINWPVDDDGRAVNRLDRITVANDIEHTAAHDALSDVDATIGVARLLKSRQPRLFEYTFTHRSKTAASTLLNLRERELMLYSGRGVPPDRHHLAAIVPICRHPTNSNAVIALDLDTAPELLHELDAAELQARVFSRRDEQVDHPRVGLLTIKTNACPVLAPFKTLRPADAERLGMDVGTLHRRRQTLIDLLDAPLLAKIESVMDRDYADGHADPDGSLYSSGFLSGADRRALDDIRQLPPTELGRVTPGFEDTRLNEMLWRYRARNWPDSLTGDERRAWKEQVCARLDDADTPWLNWRTFRQAMDAEPWPDDQADLRRELLQYCDELQLSCRADHHRR